MGARPLTPEMVADRLEKRRAQNRKAFNSWYHANKERAREYNAKKHAANPSRRKEIKAAWEAKYPDRAKASRRKTRLKRLYGLTIEEVDAMIIAQDGGCAICKCKEPTAKGWHVDHCHETGKVRGILCHHCNGMLGHARDQTALLDAGIKYLKKAMTP